MEVQDGKFPCDRCGLCCKNLKDISLYADLNRGDGICRFLDETSNLCKIYQERPTKCNVIKSYTYFANQMEYEAYIELNMEACMKLKEEKKCHYH